MPRHLWLFAGRHRALSPEAPSVQSLCSAGGLAESGASVDLLLEPLGEVVGRDEVLAYYGVDPALPLGLRWLPARRTWGSFALRAAILRGALEGRVLRIRSWKLADQVLAVLPRARVLFEAHEVPSASARDEGLPEARIGALLGRERRVLGRLRGLVANAPGTLGLLAEGGPLPAAQVLHNAARPAGPRGPEGEGVGYLGSLRAYKDLEVVAQAARLAGVPVTVVGGDPMDPFARRLVDLSGGLVTVEPPIAPAAVPGRLRQFQALILPLSPGLFGAALTSPLKLQDYLASGVAFVAADTPAVRAVTDHFEPYTPGDPASLAQALGRLTQDPERRRILGGQGTWTWGDRGRALAAFADELWP